MRLRLPRCRLWLLLAPRDYLSAFIKAGAIFSLAAGILGGAAHVLIAAVERFIDGSGPVFAGKIFSVLLYHHRLRSHQ